MLENSPSHLGYALRGVRTGFETIVSEGDGFADVPDVLIERVHVGACERVGVRR